MAVERHTRLAAAALLVLSALYVPAWAGSELTFDMSPHQEQCFYEQVERGVTVSVDFQVSDWARPHALARIVWKW